MAKLTIKLRKELRKDFGLVLLLGVTMLAAYRVHLEHQPGDHALRLLASVAPAHHEPMPEF